MNGYIEQDKRKKILFIGDDLRFFSGVATISRNLVTGTAHNFNYFAIGGSMKHPDKGKMFDLSHSTNELTGMTDSQVLLLPVDGYGDPDLIRNIIKQQEPDALVFITDPRYYSWFFPMEHELRQKLPLVYISIWDEAPAPLYNQAYYHSVDMALCISKQTALFTRQVLGEEYVDDVMIRYFPHGVDHNHFRPLGSNDDNIDKLKKQLFGDKEYDFTVLFNSRNINRKSVADIMLAFKALLKKLPKEKADKCAIILHTQPMDDNGTDLYAVREMIFGDKQSQVIFSAVAGTVDYMCALYNLADVTCLLSSNEGFGLSGLESMMCGTPIIVNMTGGMQDYCRIIDENGEWFTPNDKVWSNHNKTYTTHGEWAFPVWPSNLSLKGSIPTPYIFDSRMDFKEAADRLLEVYNLPKEERKQRGLKGREWAMSDEAKMSNEKMCESFISYMNELFSKWQPRHEYEIIRIDSNIPVKTIELPDYIFENNR